MKAHFKTKFVNISMMPRFPCGASGFPLYSWKLFGRFHACLNPSSFPFPVISLNLRRSFKSLHWNVVIVCISALAPSSNLAIQGCVSFWGWKWHRERRRHRVVVPPCGGVNFAPFPSTLAMLFPTNSSNTPRLKESHIRMGQRSVWRNRCKRWGQLIPAPLHFTLNFIV